MGETYYLILKWRICSWSSFNSKYALQEASKIYSIKEHREFVVVASSKKFLVLRCKKAKGCQCPWKLRAMLVKDTCLFFLSTSINDHILVSILT